MSTATKKIERAKGQNGLASIIRRVKIRNYKSIKNCDVELKPFTILVGRNGSEKSNFLDALRFLSDGLWVVSLKTDPARDAVVRDRRPRHTVRRHHDRVGGNALIGRRGRIYGLPRTLPDNLLRVRFRKLGRA